MYIWGFATVHAVVSALTLMERQYSPLGAKPFLLCICSSRFQHSGRCISLGSRKNVTIIILGSSGERLGTVWRRLEASAPSSNEMRDAKSARTLLLLKGDMSLQ